MRRRILCLVIASVMLVVGCGSKSEEKGKAKASGVDANGNFTNEAVLDEIPEHTDMEVAEGESNEVLDYSEDELQNEADEVSIPFKDFGSYSGELSDELGYELISSERVLGGGWSNAMWYLTLANTSNKAFEMNFTAKLYDADGNVVMDFENSDYSVIFPSGGQIVGMTISGIYTEDDYYFLDECTLEITPISMTERSDVSDYTDSVAVKAVPTKNASVFDVGLYNNGDAENVVVNIVVCEEPDDGHRSVYTVDYHCQNGEWTDDGTYGLAYWYEEGNEYYYYAYCID